MLADQPFKILNKHFDKITNLFLDGAVLKTEQLNYVAQYIGNIIKNGIFDEKLADLFNGLSEDREKAIKFLTTVSQNLDVIKSMGDDFQKTGEIISKYIDLNIDLNQTIANAKSNGLDNQNIADIISSLYELNMDNENNIADSLNMVELVLPAASSLINSGEVETYSLCKFISKATNRSFSRNNIKNIIFTAISGEYHNGIALFNSINSNIDSIYALVEQQNIEVDSIFRLLLNLSERGLDDNAIKNVFSSIANEYRDNANGIINSLNDNISSIARNDNIADVIKSFNILLNYGLDKKQISDIVEFRKDEIRDNTLIISLYPHKLSNTFSIPNAMFGLENKIDDIKVNEMNVSFGIGTLKNTHGLSAQVVPTIVFSGSPLADNQKIEVKLGYEMNPIDFATSVKNIGFEETLYLPQYRDLLYRNGSDRISLVTKDSNGVDVVDSNLIGKFRLTNNPTLNMVFDNLSLSNNKSLSRQ